MNARSILAIGIVVIAFPALAPADVVLLSNNQQLTGEVTEDGNSYIIKTAGGTVRVEKSDVVSIKRDKPPSSTGQANSKPPIAQDPQAEAHIADLRAKAGLGDVDAEIELANAYRLGTGVPKDAAEAVKWYRKVVDAGNEAGLIQLGIMYAAGEAVPRDKLEAITWLRKGADSGHAPCMAVLGFMYLDGRGAPRDDDEALKWFRKGTDAGNGRCMAGLGSMYLDGRGVAKDDAEAVKWLRKGVDWGDSFAMANLGVCYETGQGLPQDYAEAVKWFRKAADVGNALGMFKLGNMYKTGQGVTRDDDEAARWLRKATAAGYEPAPKEQAGVAVTVGNVSVSWDVPVWAPATTIGDGNPIAKACPIKIERHFANMTLYGGIAIGDAARSKDDDAYKRYLADTLNLFKSGLPNKTAASRTLRQVNGSEFDIISAGSGLKVGKVYVGVQGGYCISYWFVGNPNRLDEFEKAVGQASIKAAPKS